MYQPGDKVKIIEGIYSGHEVEIAEQIGWVDVTDTNERLYGYSVYGLTTHNAKMSTFWDDQLEKLVLNESGNYVGNMGATT